MSTLPAARVHEKSYTASYVPVVDDDPITSFKDRTSSPDRTTSAVSPARTDMSRKTEVLAVMRQFRTALLPVIALAYLSFCYTVHCKVVPLKSQIIDASAANLSLIKSGVTSISILVIAIGLLPVQALVGDLRGEEFFRVLNTKASGTPLSSINAISTPSFGIFESLSALLRRHCSPYLAISFTAGLLALATSTLAPASLSVSTAWFDGDILALSVPAVPRDSVYNATSSPPQQALFTGPLFDKAASVAWVEDMLGVPYPPQVVDPGRYIVPAPIHLPLNVSARWLSDVIVMEPECLWSNARIERESLTGPTLYILDRDLTITEYSDFGPVSNNWITFQGLFLTNTTDTGVTQNGAAVFAIQQCSFNCTENDPLVLNLTGIPTVVAEYPSNPRTFDAAFLICLPHATIETREVRSDGHGFLTVVDTPYPVKQGNLNFAQVQMLFTYALQSIGDRGGPLTHLGTEMQTDFIFGPGAAKNLTENSGFGLPTMTVTPAPLSQITETYARTIQSAMKLLLRENNSTTYVPARISTQQIIFTSSLPQVIASTVLFALLIAIIIISHFRREMPNFTLFSVAASLDGSRMPSLFAQARNDSDPSVKESELIKTYEGRKVTLNKSDATQGILELQ